MGMNIAKVERNVLVIANTSLPSTRQFIHQLHSQLQQNRVCHCYSLVEYEEGCTKVIEATDRDILDKIDLVFVIGENQDLFKVFSLYLGRDSPPIFGIGNTKNYQSPLLYNYSFQNAQIITSLVFHEPDWKVLPTDNLMKLELSTACDKLGEATCQVEINKAMNQAVVIINIYIENSCEKEIIKIGQFKGDGLLISTPMGSFCKSLTFNGPLMDRNMENIMITPICPLSMKFRPLCLPASTTIFLQIDKSSRSQTVQIYIDETSQHSHLAQGDFLRIRMSKNKTRIISNLIQTNEEFFIRNLRTMLRWGQNYENIEIDKAKLERRMSNFISEGNLD